MSPHPHRRPVFPLFLFALSLAGCFGGGSKDDDDDDESGDDTGGGFGGFDGGGSDGGDGGDGGEEEPPCATGDFASGTAEWSLPRISNQDDWMDDMAEDFSCGSGTLSAGLVDMTGDGMPDLVVTDYCDGSGVGTDNWNVYENTGSGFADDATTWSLPNLLNSEDFMDDLAEDSSCGSGSFAASVLDMTGDGMPDLVVTDFCDSAGVGTDNWNVYENTGSGFSDSKTEWSLPNLRNSDDFMDDLAEDSSCGSGSFAASVVDMTGDGMPDLVVTDFCDAAGVGTDNWKVYENTGSGFSDNDMEWSLPRLINSDDFMDDLAEDNSCGSGSLAASVIDMTGDGLPDLLVTDFCDSAGVGTDEWHVYENTGSGFADNETSWSLPSLRNTDDWMDDTYEDTSCGSGSFAAAVMDTTGDGLPDLVVTDFCDEAGVGTDSWEIYSGTASGFADSPLEWSLPSLRNTDDWMDDLAEDTSCGSGSYAASVSDLNGDGILDLVVTDYCDETSVGTDNWEVVYGTCQD